MQEKGQRMSEQAKATIFRLIDNWQGTLIIVCVLILFSPTALAAWLLAQQGGYVNSGMSYELNVLVEKVSGNQVLLSGLYYQSFAKCLQDAAREAKEEGWYLNRMEQACRDADDRLSRHMATLGVRIAPSYDGHNGK